MVMSIAIKCLKFKTLSLILVIISTINSFLIKSNYFNAILVFLVCFINCVSFSSIGPIGNEMYHIV